MVLVWWILVGIALAVIAKWVTGRRIGWIPTLIAGVAGAFVGGLVGHLLGFGGIMRDFSIWSLIIAAVLSVVFLLVLSALPVGRNRRRR